MQMMASLKQKTIISSVVFILFLGLILNAVANRTYTQGLNDLKEQGNIRLELYINYLQGVLGKYESLPELLALDNNLVRTLLDPYTEYSITSLNEYLETINRVSGALDTYLMNKDGLTIAASNWKEEHPFIGKNFSYRPYFQDAMLGKLGRYFAIGTTSSKRGYYFAYPVRKDEVILGAVAIKIDIDSVEKKWAHQNANFLVTDPEGVIFITTNPQWRYRTLQPLAEDVLKNIVESQRYPDAQLAPLVESMTSYENDFQILNIKNRQGGEVTEVVKQSLMMPHAGWNVHILSDTGELRSKVLLVNIQVALGLTIIFIMMLLFIQRRSRLAELDIIEQKSKTALKEANELLESRVYDRTLQLTESNELLRQEILERKQTEVQLKRTRKELIHAAKLAALGQMSAGINHELNQPLAAIRSYADNGKQFLQKGRMDEAMWNLEQIGELTERMAQIGVQLKHFSKKSSGRIVTVPMHGVIDGALEIVNPSLKRLGIAANIQIHPNDLEVRANHVLLQQVIVNLLSNAIQAVESQVEKKISIECNGNKNLAMIAVEDNGPGVSEDHIQEIFEPFFTTKKSGQGLGLGLTISDRIVRDFGGQIFLVHTQHGTRFEFTLERTK
jgi:two-component system, NtrC family, C4-dicarboxylate transport sensor histidine kinase DctB